VTFWYRAPEIFLGLPYDARADVWSFGLVLLYLLTSTHVARRSHESGEASTFLEDLMDHFGTPEWLSLETYAQKHGIQYRPHKPGLVDFESMLTRFRPDLDIHVSRQCADLLKHMLSFHPETRYRWNDVLQHPVWALVAAYQHVPNKYARASLRKLPRDCVPNIRWLSDSMLDLYPLQSNRTVTISTDTLPLSVLSIAQGRERWSFNRQVSATTQDLAHYIYEKLSLLDITWRNEATQDICFFFANALLEDIRQKDSDDWSNWSKEPIMNIVPECLCVMTNIWPMRNLEHMYTSMQAQAKKLGLSQEWIQQRRHWPLLALHYESKESSFHELSNKLIALQT